jgi:3-oxosteroid 1-dehydrogenase
MSEQLKDQYDLVIVGSGAAGLVGAIAAAKRGLSVVIIEKAKVWGGTTALSGGAMWIPCNHFMARDGEPTNWAKRSTLYAAIRGIFRRVSR